VGVQWSNLRAVRDAMTRKNDLLYVSQQQVVEGVHRLLSASKGPYRVMFGGPV